MPYQPIENYGIIGNMRTVALVGMNGSIDWFCFPHVDSPSVFGALLDDAKGGRFQIYAVDGAVRTKQSYWLSTNILVTRFFTEDGIAEVEDFMPVREGDASSFPNHLHRRVRCVRGRVRLRMLCRPAFDYGRATHRVSFSKGGALFESEGLCLSLASTVPLQEEEQGGASADFVLQQGEMQRFIIKEGKPGEGVSEPPPEREAEELFAETVKYWQHWLSSCTYRGRWRESVHRSALVLKLLTFAPTGAIVAAATASLPEVIGGERNWDYRYTWLRDAAFTVYAFLRLGFSAEASAYIGWMREFIAKNPQPEERTHSLLTVHGDSHIPEIILSHWEGYRGSGPVRIGNGAVEQFQSDIYGETMDSIYLYNKHVTLVPYDFWTHVRARLNWICENWQRPDQGIWEMRNREEQFVYSKVMNWVALDRGIRLADKRSFPADRARWTVERDRIYEEVMTKGWNEKLKAFTQVYGGEDLDASLLVMPLVFFLAPTDPRMIGTLEAILRDPKDGGLVSDSLVYRYPPSPRIDGLPGEEGTFNMCSFWLVEALTRAGQNEPAKLEQARIIFERMLGYANHLGLFAEQTSAQGEALGNFPQAFTHLSLISAAFNLDRTMGSAP